MGQEVPDDKTVQKLVHLSQEVRANAYCPYSQTQVGAALLCEDGTIYTGCNVENASYGLTICAERTAIVKAVSEGRRYFKAMAVASNMKDYTMPCGNCRQFILEFGPDIVVYAVGNSGQILAKRADELLPFAFTGCSARAGDHSVLDEFCRKLLHADTKEYQNLQRISQVKFLQLLSRLEPRTVQQHEPANE